MSPTAINLSPQQSSAFDAVKTWLKTDQQIFRLFGYAGTGKTTLAQEIARATNRRLVLFAAYTGKAALVMRQKGCDSAQTIHSLIYTIKHPVKEKPEFTLNHNSHLRYADLLIIDECSMVNDEIARDLLSFKKKILVLGDPAQLPPVEGTGFFTNAQSDILLTEVHRQARENPIINLSIETRIGMRFDLGLYGESRVVPKAAISSVDILTADQVIVGRNRTRRDYNHCIRNWQGLPTGDPLVGDKLICLRNDHNLGIYNGSMWEIVHTNHQSSKHLYKLLLRSREEDYREVSVEVREEFFSGRESSLTWQDKRNTQEFTFGYAITCHKAQGSQWDNVLLIDESNAFREDAVKWRYTGLTRAAKVITIGV